MLGLCESLALGATVAMADLIRQAEVHCSTQGRVLALAWNLYVAAITISISEIPWLLACGCDALVSIFKYCMCKELLGPSLRPSRLGKWEAGPDLQKIRCIPMRCPTYYAAMRPQSIARLRVKIGEYITPDFKY